MIGGFIGPIIRKITPRAALLGHPRGVSVAFIAMRPALEMFMTPVIGIVCFSVIPRELVRRRPLLPRPPCRLVPIGVGTAIAWGSTALGFNFGGLSRPAS